MLLLFALLTATAATAQSCNDVKSLQQRSADTDQWFASVWAYQNGAGSETQIDSFGASTGCRNIGPYFESLIVGNGAECYVFGNSNCGGNYALYQSGHYTSLSVGLAYSIECQIVTYGLKGDNTTEASNTTKVARSGKVTLHDPQPSSQDRSIWKRLVTVQPEGSEVTEFCGYIFSAQYYNGNSAIQYIGGSSSSACHNSYWPILSVKVAPGCAADLYTEGSCVGDNTGQFFSNAPYIGGCGDLWSAEYSILG